MEKTTKLHYKIITKRPLSQNIDCDIGGFRQVGCVRKTLHFYRSVMQVAVQSFVSALAEFVHPPVDLGQANGVFGGGQALGGTAAIAQPPSLK